MLMLHYESAHAMPSSRAASVERKSLIATVSSALPALPTTPSPGRSDPFASTPLSTPSEASSPWSPSAAVARAVAAAEAYRKIEWMIHRHEESVDKFTSLHVVVSATNTMVMAARDCRLVHQCQRILLKVAVKARLRVSCRGARNRFGFCNMVLAPRKYDGADHEKSTKRNRLQQIVVAPGSK